MVEDEDGNNAAMLIQLKPLLVFLVPPGRASLCPISQSPSSSLVSSSLGIFLLLQISNFKHQSGIEVGPIQIRSALLERENNFHI